MPVEQNMSNFHPLEVVGSGSDAQLQVGEKLNKLTWRDECVGYANRKK